MQRRCCPSHPPSPLHMATELVSLTLLPARGRRAGKLLPAATGPAQRPKMGAEPDLDLAWAEDAASRRPLGQRSGEQEAQLRLRAGRPGEEGEGGGSPAHLGPPPRSTAHAGVPAPPRAPPPPRPRARLPPRPCPHCPRPPWACPRPWPHPCSRPRLGPAPRPLGAPYSQPTHSPTSIPSTLPPRASSPSSRTHSSRQVLTVPSFRPCPHHDLVLQASQRHPAASRPNPNVPNLIACSYNPPAPAYKSKEPALSAYHAQHRGLRAPQETLLLATQPPCS